MVHNTRWLKIVGVAAALLMLVGLFGSSLVAVHAQDNPRASHGLRLDIWGTLLEATKDVTGLSADQIKDGLKNGKSLADIINAVGGGVDKVEANARAKLIAQIEDAYTSGKITRRQADRLKDHLDGALDRLIHRHFGGKPQPASTATPAPAQ